jgi:MFS family permease
LRVFKQYLNDLSPILTAASDRYGRKLPHAAGWVAGLVLAALLLSAGSNWTQYVIADIFLGAQQGLAWTTNIFMFMDILGPDNRALASGISNSTGYIASAIANFIADALISAHGIHSVFVFVLVSVLLGLVVSVCFLKDTTKYCIVFCCIVLYRKYNTD